MGVSYQPILPTAANTKMVIGTYTGNGAANRLIVIGGKPWFGVVLGDDIGLDERQSFLVNGTVAYLTNPTICMRDASNCLIRNDGPGKVVSVGTGFTLGSGAPDNNRNLVDYYYLMMMVV